jgi:hypothetical protein
MIATAITIAILGVEPLSFTGKVVEIHKSDLKIVVEREKDKKVEFRLKGETPLYAWNGSIVTLERVIEEKVKDETLHAIIKYYRTDEVINIIFYTKEKKE